MEVLLGLSPHTQCPIETNPMEYESTLLSSIHSVSFQTYSEVRLLGFGASVLDEEWFGVFAVGVPRLFLLLVGSGLDGKGENEKEGKELPGHDGWENS